ncbi:hypothetical protein [Paraburkholderia xenovorans]|uniref:hypothetical protein n=1 Tax=Paraburkholderia xenovorans TaxID=36873 RepID=UPI0038B6C896
MVYKGPYADIIYPSSTREPRVARYRLVLSTHTTGVRAIVHLLRSATDQSQEQIPDTALDVLLNRIIGMQLIGIRLDCIRFVVQKGNDFIAYPIRFNALDIAPRSADRSRGTKDHPVHIRSQDVFGGSVPFYIDRDEGKPAAAKIAKMLRQE